MILLLKTVTAGNHLGSEHTKGCWEGCAHKSTTGIGKCAPYKDTRLSLGFWGVFFWGCNKHLIRASGRQPSDGRLSAPARTDGEQRWKSTQCTWARRALPLLPSNLVQFLWHPGLWSESVALQGNKPLLIFSFKYCQPHLGRCDAQGSPERYHLCQGKQHRLQPDTGLAYCLLGGTQLTGWLLQEKLKVWADKENNCIIWHPQP